MPLPKALQGNVVVQPAWMLETREERGERRRAQFANNEAAGRKPWDYGARDIYEEAAGPPLTDLWLTARQQMYYGAKRVAKQQGLTLTISIGDVVTDGFCPILEVPLVQGKGHSGPGPSSPHLDRIDKSRGYEPDNVAVISYRAHYLRGEMTARTALKLAKYLGATCATVASVVNVDAS